MASKSPRKQEKQQADDLITCAISLDYFDDPRLLPCAHTYCLRCIQKIASSNHDQFECPLRDGTIIKKDHIDSLPINRVVRDMIDVLPNIADTNDHTRKTSSPMCSECLSAVSEFWCVDCPTSYCAACCTDIHRGRQLSQHRRLPIDQKPAEAKRCEKHHDERLRFWCSCETLTCRDCQLSREHKDHQPVPIDEVGLEITEKLRDEFKGAQVSLNNAKAQESGSETTNMQSITHTFSVVRKMIDNHEQALKNQVGAIEEKNKTSSSKYLALLDNKQETLSKHNEECENILSTKDYTQLLEAKKGLTDYLEQLKKELKELKPPAKTEYRIEGVDQLQVSIENILKQARIIEQKAENQGFAEPGTYKELGCKGHACASCGKCRDWYFTGDRATWKWIGNIKNWDKQGVERWNNGRFWEHFQRRSGAACGGHGGGHYCLCDNNIAN